uniref:RIN4 pathogenic type III effector avirulence factor Avr cleavage site domain-containing protein n=1 Tax=Aegilops tauschii TaxID=37682 RepID=R7WEU3_AEGTA
MANNPTKSGHYAQNKGRSLPKFGEWDVKNPATADGFTVIFQRARDDKKTTAGPGRPGIPPALRNADGRYGTIKNGNGYQHARRRAGSPAPAADSDAVAACRRW